MYKLYHYNVNWEGSNNTIYIVFFNNNIHSYNTRSKEKYHIPSVTTNINKFSIKCHKPQIYNNIPPYTKSAKSVKHHKNY